MERIPTLPGTAIGNRVYGYELLRPGESLSLRGTAAELARARAALRWMRRRHPELRLRWGWIERGAQMRVWSGD